MTPRNRPEIEPNLFGFLVIGASHGSTVNTVRKMGCAALADPAKKHREKSKPISLLASPGI
jgi:hypothetical protein